MTDAPQAPRSSPIGLHLTQAGCNFPRTFNASARRKSKTGTFSTAVREEPGLSRSHVPGPGTYTEQDSFVWHHDSISQKGYTAGFASQAPRLDTGHRYTGPGPGTLSFTQQSQGMLCWLLCSHPYTATPHDAGSYQAPQWGDKLYTSSKTCTIAAPPTAQVRLMLAADTSQNTPRVLSQSTTCVHLPNPY